MTDTTITSTFYEKIASACRKKEALFDENLGRYALRSMFAGAYLTMSTAVGVVAALQPMLFHNSHLPLDDLLLLLFLVSAWFMFCSSMVS
ncbi:hypothetical protein SM3g_00780 [Streptococcus mutans]|nr:hypothetical protein SM3g_00780 [Streptococcus mutans]SQF47804.1 nitrite transporter [Streptococcus mutans]